MANKEEMRSKIEALKADQEALKRELSELDTFMERKARTPEREAPREEAPREYERPRPPRREEYQEPRRERYQPPAREYEPREERYAPRGGREMDVTDLLRTNISETRGMIEKFDYLLDVLLDSMEEVETSNTDQIIKTLAETQAHTIDLLDNIKGTLETTQSQTATKTELDEFERNQARNYQEMNKKMATILDQVTQPPYLQELDAIRVAVSNMTSQIKDIQAATGVGISDDVKEQVSSLKSTAASLEERLGLINDSVSQMGDKLNAVQSTTSSLGELKSQITSMEAKLLAHDEQILTETDRKTENVEQKIAELDKHLHAIEGIEERLEKATTALKSLDEIPLESLQQITDMKKEFAELRAGMPKLDLSELKSKLDELDASIKDLVKKKLEQPELNPFQGTGVEKLEKRVRSLERAVKAGEVIDFYNTKRDADRLREIFGEVGQLRGEVDKLKSTPQIAANGPAFQDALGELREEVAELKAEKRVPEEVEERLAELERLVKASEVIGTYSLERNSERLDAMEGELKKLESTSVPEAGDSANRLRAIIEDIRMKGELTIQDITKLSANLEELEEIRSQLGALQKDVSFLQRRGETPRDEVAERVAHIEERGTVDTTVNELRRQLTELQDAHEKLSLDLQGKKAVDRAVREKRNEEIQCKLQELHDQVSGIKEQQLNERLTAVAGKLQQVTVTMQSKDTVHDAHISELEGAVSQLSAEAAKAQDVKAQLAEMRSELAGAADLQRLKELYSSIDRKSQTLETRLTNDETAEKLVRIKENKDIGNSLSMITAALEDIRAQNLDDKVTGLAGRLAELARGMRDADTATLKQLVDLKGAYNELNANVAFKKEVAERFHDIAKSLATLDSMVASTKQKAAEQRAETETNVKQAIRALDNKLAMMQQEAAATHQKDVSEIEKRAASATRRLDELKRNVEAEDENYLKLAQNVDDIHARTVELVSKLGVGEEEDKRISDEIAHLKSALKRLGDSSVKGADYTQAMARVVTEITKLEQELEAVKAAEGELAQGESVDREQLTLIAGLVRQLDEKTESELVAKMKDSQQSLERADDTKALKKELLEFRKDAEADKTKFKRILHRVTTLEQAVAGGQKSEIKAGIKELGEEVAEHERKLGHRPAQEKLAKSAEKVKEFLARGEGTAAEASELRRQLFSIEHELSTGNPEYQQLAQRVEEIKEKFTKLSAKGAKPPELQSVRKGLTEVLEDLLDLELEKRGLTEALSRVRKANEELASPTPDYKRANAIIKSAHKLLEYERETLNDLRIDLKDAEARFPEVEGILARRERQEEALKKEAEAKPPANEEIDAAYAQFKRSIERMRAAREAIKREEPTGTRAVESPALLRRELRLMDERVPFADTRSLEGAAVGLNEIGESLEGATPAPRVDRAVGMLGDAAVKAKEAQLAAEQKRFESPETRGEMEAREAVLQIAGEKLAEAQEKLEQVRGLPLPPPPRLKVDEEKIVLAAVSRIPLGAFATVQDLARSAGIPSGRVRALLSAGGAGFVFDGTIVERTG